MESEAFLEYCLDGYESEMDSRFYTSTTTADFIKHHDDIKTRIIAQLSQKWSSIFEDIPMPNTYIETVGKNIDNSFRHLKKHFEKSQARDKNKLLAISAQQEAIQFYNEELEKYIRFHPSASPKEIEMQHAKCSLQAISKACENGGVAMTAEAVSNFKMELEKRRLVYNARAAMSFRNFQNPAIGIDLGTTMCCVMVFNEGKVQVIQNRLDGNRSTTPSFVAYHEDGTITSGMTAKEAAYRHPETTIYDAKRMIGRHWSDRNLQSDLQHWPFKLVKDGNQPKISTWAKLRSPQDVSARLLAGFRVMAAQHLGLTQDSVRRAVITVPAYFTESQRRATREAAECAGLEVLNILSEPTAATIAYCWERTESEKKRILVYDLGGGTFDVAIAEVTKDKVEILGVDGDTHLGGQDVDQLLMDYCIDEFKKTSNIDLLASRKGIKLTPLKTIWSVTDDDTLSNLSRLKSECEKAKERLSTAEFATVEVMGVVSGKNLAVEITRSKLNELVRPLVQTTIDIVTRALIVAKEKGVSSKLDIDDVILIGGSTRIPLVVEMVTEYFDGKEPCQNINPDEAVAYGAAVQAAMLNNAENIRKVEVQDVTAMTIGLGSLKDDFGRVIPKNSKIPCTYSQSRVTVADNQTSCCFNIYQGEYNTASRNKWLGTFVLDGVPPKPAGEEGATVIMTINEMGILHVEAKQPTTGSSNSITITADKLGMTDVEMSTLREEIRMMTIQ